MSRFVMFLVLVVLVGLSAKVSAQTIIPCNQTTAVQPFIYNISNLATSICPDRPVSGSQDALLCIPGPVSATIASFSLTSSNSVAHPEVCIMRNTTLCGDIGEGEFDGIVIKLSTFPLSGNLEISGLLKVYYGNGSRPLEIVSDKKTLSIPGSVTIVERVFGRLDLTSVCEILDDGTYIATEFSTTVGTSDCLEAADGSPNINLGVAGSLLLESLALSSQRTATLVTLVLIPSTASCSPTAEKLSDIFNITIEVNQTTTTPDPIPPSSTQPWPVIIGSVLGVLLGAGVLVAIILCVVYVYKKLHPRTHPHVVEDDTDFTMKPISRGVRVSDNFSTGHINKRDSGFGSPPAPLTPADDCTVIVACDYNDPWYPSFKKTLGTNFRSSMKELVLTENLKEFETNFNNELFLPQVKHLLLIENVDEANQSFYSSCLKKFIGLIDSGACDDVSKVWYIQLGVHEEFDTHTAIHRLGITQSKANSKSEKCANRVHKRISSYDLLHPSGDEGVGKTTSLGPHSIWDSHLGGGTEQETTSSLPPQLVEYLEDIKSNAAVAAQNTQALRADVNVAAENVRKVGSTVAANNDLANRTLALVEEDADRRERKNLVIPDDTEELATES